MIKKVIYIFTGTTSVILGCLGIFLPVLPTTPLFLLALYCFAKSSERLTRWFKDTALYKRYLEEYVQLKSLTLKQKLAVQISSGFMMTISFILANNHIIRIILIIGFLIHNYIFIFKIKTRKNE